MVWTEITRRQYRRADLRYASDVTETEWRLLAPLMPPPCKVGRPREIDLRAVVNAILYIAATGCQWRGPPQGCAPRSPPPYYFFWWCGRRPLDRAHLLLGP